MDTLLRAGADPLVPALHNPDQLSMEEPEFFEALPIHIACQGGDGNIDAPSPRVISLLLAAACVPEQFDARRTYDGYTPLMLLGSTIMPYGDVVGIRVECAKLLLDAGASLDGALEIARATQAGKASKEGAEKCAPFVQLLEDAAALRYSPATHHLFPRPCREFALRMLVLGRQLAHAYVWPRSSELIEVWAAIIMPLLVSRTSRISA